MTTESLIVSELMSDPAAIVSPIVRNGNAVTIGVDEVAWNHWLETGK